MSEEMTSRAKSDGPGGLSESAKAMVAELAAKEHAEPFTGVVIFCPVCCTNMDAADWGVLEYDCNNCTTKFVLNLTPEVVREFSMYGG